MQLELEQAGFVFVKLLLFAAAWILVNNVSIR
jgi:hypothetical protein